MSNDSKSERLVELDFEEARRVKWVNGIFEYRGGDVKAKFVGNRLAETFNECCDIVNYLEDETRETGRDFHVQIAQARQIAERVQKCWRAANKRAVGASNNGEGGNDCDE